MTPTDYRDTLRLLDFALAIFSQPHDRLRHGLRRELRLLNREFLLLRARLGQVPAGSQRN